MYEAAAARSPSLVQSADTIGAIRALTPKILETEKSITLRFV